jgi:exodeoxyribonuclease V gamma subunit
MQTYSEDNYLVSEDNTDFKPSFDANWLSLSQNNYTNDQQNSLLVGACEISDDIDTISANELIRFFQHPSKFFAQQVLNLYLESNDISLDDVEPFSANHLDNYLLKQDLLAAKLKEKDCSTVEQVMDVASLSGKFPDLPSTQLHFDEALNASSQLAQEIITQGCENPELIDCKIVLNYTLNNASKQEVTLLAQVPVKLTDNGAKIVFYRSSTAKPKDLFTLYLHYLIVQVWQEQNCAKPNYGSCLLSKVGDIRGFYFNTKAQKVEQYTINNENIETANTELSMLMRVYAQGQKQALLLNGDFAAEVFKDSRGKRVVMTEERFETFWCGAAAQLGGQPGFGQDSYIHYFWPFLPVIDTVAPQVESIYQGLYSHIVKVNASKSKSSKGASR